MASRARRIALAATVAVAVIAAGLAYVARQRRSADTVDWNPVTVQTLSHGRFENLEVYAPHGNPRGFVLLLSGRDGWSADMASLAEAVARRGAMVAGIDLAKLDANLEADGAECVFPDGDLENLSHFVQAYYRLPTYLAPIVAGRSAGAATAYAVVAQAPANTFAAAVSLGFCPTLALQKPLCKSGSLDYRPARSDATAGASPAAAAGGVQLLARPLGAPWVVSKGGDAGPNACENAAAQFLAAVPQAELIAAADDSHPGGSQPALDAIDALLARNAPAAAQAPPAALADLPLIALAAQSGQRNQDTFAIILSGDGGWAGLDKDVAAALTADGIPVVGLDSLRYFWSARTPAGLAADLDRIIRYYATSLGRSRVMLIGYSQGADVLPFAVNRLSPAARTHVALTALMGLSDHALFEFHMTNWVSDDDSGPPTLPEVRKITDIPVLCIYGEDESDTLCPNLDPRQATIVKLKGGHHFDGDYAGLARTILAAVRP